MPVALLERMRQHGRRSPVARVIALGLALMLLLHLAECCEFLSGPVTAPPAIAAPVSLHSTEHAHDGGATLLAEICAWLDNAALAPVTAVPGGSALAPKLVVLAVLFFLLGTPRVGVVSLRWSRSHSPPSPRLPLYLRSARLRI